MLIIEEKFEKEWKTVQKIVNSKPIPTFFQMPKYSDFFELHAFTAVKLQLQNYSCKMWLLAAVCAGCV